MKVINIKKQLEKVSAKDITIKAQEARWGGWNVEMTARLGIDGYYDFHLLEQIHKTLDVKTEQDAITVFLQKDIDSFASKPHHDHNDPMSDYNAWNYYETIQAIDRLAAREVVRA